MNFARFAGKEIPEDFRKQAVEVCFPGYLAGNVLWAIRYTNDGEIMGWSEDGDASFTHRIACALLQAYQKGKEGK